MGISYEVEISAAQNFIDGVIAGKRHDMMKCQQFFIQAEDRHMADKLKYRLQCAIRSGRINTRGKAVRIGREYEMVYIRVFDDERLADVYHQWNAPHSKGHLPAVNEIRKYYGDEHN